MTQPIATEREWTDERARLGGYSSEWDHHNYDTYDEGGRYASSIQHASDVDKMGSIEEFAARISQLSRSDDPRARLQAVELAELLKYRIVLPDQTWTVTHHYGHSPGAFMRKRVWVFSAHYSRENANLWLPYVRKAYPDRNWKVERRDQVRPYCLVRPEADPSTCVRRR